MCSTSKQSIDCHLPPLAVQVFMENILIFICVLGFCSTMVKSQLTELFYDGFSALDNITLDGDAQFQNGRLRLTRDSTRLLGHAFFSSPIRLKNSAIGAAFSFSTCFAIAMVPEYPNLGGHGLAFVISQTRTFPNARPTQYLGLLSPAANGNSSDHIFFIEFDTVQDFEFDDINDNHVGIDINSMISNASAAAAFFDDSESKEQGLNLSSGKPILAWVDYDASKNQLNVTISPTSQKPNVPLLSFDIDLSPIFKETMFVGFSASTGLLSSTHYVLGWSLKVNGEAKSLDLTSLPKLPGTRKTHMRVILVVCSGIVSVLAIAMGVAAYLIRRIRDADVIEDWELQIGPHRFSYEELRRATKGFRDKELLGFGGFGRVYRGMLPNSNCQVAVKRISHESKQGLQEFVSEIESIGRLRHRNLVHLLGWCRRRDDLILVYEFMPHGSLDKYLFDEPKTILNWEQRLVIIKGVASGLLYLHEEWQQTVIHRDIKSANVLLDSDLNGRLGDFGLAKLYERGSHASTTRVVGTLGYLTSELARTGRPTTSSDVFAFGALLLEVVCGRRPIDPTAKPEELVLVEWVWERWRTGAILSVVDPNLNGEFEEVEVVVALKLGLLCSNNTPWARPTMRHVVRYLHGEISLPEVVPAPDAYDSKNRMTVPGGVPIEFEDYVHSYPNSSIIEQASMLSSGFNDPDTENASISSLRLSDGFTGR